MCKREKCLTAGMPPSLLLESTLMVLRYRITLPHCLLLVTPMILVCRLQQNEAKTQGSCLSLHYQTTAILKTESLLSHYCSGQCNKTWITCRSPQGYTVIEKLSSLMSLFVFVSLVEVVSLKRKWNILPKTVFFFRGEKSVCWGLIETISFRSTTRV